MKIKVDGTDKRNKLQRLFDFLPSNTKITKHLGGGYTVRNEDSGLGAYSDDSLEDALSYFLETNGDAREKNISKV